MEGIALKAPRKWQLEKRKLLMMDRIRRKGHRAYLGIGILRKVLYRNRVVVYMSQKYRSELDDDSSKINLNQVLLKMEIIPQIFASCFSVHRPWELHKTGHRHGPHSFNALMPQADKALLFNSTFSHPLPGRRDFLKGQSLGIWCRLGGQWDSETARCRWLALLMPIIFTIIKLCKAFATRRESHLVAKKKYRFRIDFLEAALLIITTFRRHGSEQLAADRHQLDTLRCQGRCAESPEWYADDMPTMLCITLADGLLSFDSRHELYRDGGQGARGYQQRTVGRIIDSHARDRGWHFQLVCVC